MTPSETLGTEREPMFDTYFRLADEISLMITKLEGTLDALFGPGIQGSEAKPSQGGEAERLRDQLQLSSVRLNELYHRSKMLIRLDKVDDVIEVPHAPQVRRR